MCADLLRDKSVVITGAARGLGRAYALEAAAQGASLLVNDVDEDPLREVAAEIEDARGKVAVVVGSVADWDVARSLTDRCVATYGKIDGLVNNAGLHHTGKAWEEDPAELKAEVDVNVTGVLYCGVNALRVMVDQGSGSIINITSGAHIGLPEMSTYSATKGAVASATYVWALDAAEHGVRVNAVSPVALTRMTTVWEHPASELAVASSPPPEDIAPLVSYLLSDAAVGITGQVIRLDKEGLSVMMPPHFPTEAVVLPERTVEEVAKALEGPLSGEMRHVGLGQWIDTPTVG